MSKQTNADLIAEAQTCVTDEYITPDTPFEEALIRRLAAALEAAEKRAEELAAVVEKVREWAGSHSGSVVSIIRSLLASAPQDTLREHDAKVQAETLREFAHSIPGDIHDPRHVADLARGVADHIEKEAGL